MRINDISIHIIFALFLSCSVTASGWYNGNPHQPINERAWSAFLTKYVIGPGEKGRFGRGPISDATFSAETGMEQNVLREGDVRLERRDLPISLWIKHGGFSADVPSVKMGLVHFWDPTEGSETPVSGALTDIDSGPASAYYWGLRDADNRYSWRWGIANYRESIENDKLTPADRNNLLAKSFQALGETMHLLGDMTCPAHVRNDGHPGYGAVGDGDPIEAAIGLSLCEIAGNGGPGGRYKGLIPRDVQLTGVTPEQLFRNVAMFTNAHFFSDDTIYSDSAPACEPYNGLKRYASPQLNRLEEVDGTFFTTIPLKNAQTGADAGSIKIPLAVAWNFTDWAISGVTKGKSRTHAVPSSLAADQALVLMPLAIHACAELANLFFPTLEMTATIQGIPAKRADSTGFHLEAALIHKHQDDPAWKDLPPLKYAGPATLVWHDSNGAEHRLALAFNAGCCSQDIDLPAGAKPLRVEADAGGRRFLSEPFPVTEPVGESPTTWFISTARNDEIVFADGRPQGASMNQNTFVFTLESNDPREIARGGFPPKNAEYAWEIEDNGAVDNVSTTEPRLKRSFSYKGGNLAGMMGRSAKIRLTVTTSGTPRTVETSVHVGPTKVGKP